MTTSRTKHRLGRMVLSLSALLVNTSYAVEPSGRSELIALSDSWIDAEVGHNKAALEQILDDRFLATFSSGKTIDRKAYVDWIMKTDIEPFKVLNEVVDIHGDTALVISTTTDHEIKFTWIAVKRDGRWRVISETFSKITGQL